MKTGDALKAVEPAPSMTVEACSKMVEAATKTCAPTEAAPAPNWDAMANSFASLSLAFTWGTIILAVIALIGAVAWGWFVKGWAEKEARIEAERCAKLKIDEWLAVQAPQIVRRHFDNLQDATLGNGDDAQAADEIGKEAG